MCRKTKGISVLILAIFVLLPTIARAEGGTAQEVVKKLSSTISSLGGYQVRFIANVDGYEVEGNYVVSGNRYKMVVGMDISSPETLDYEIMCDGTNSYEINHSDKEVMIDKIDPNDRNILTNPTRAFDFAEDSFKMQIGKARDVNGKMCDVVILTPTSKKSPFTTIEVAVDQNRSLPMELKYRITGSDSEVVVEIKSFVKNSTMSEKQFVFNAKNYSGYELIDFR